MEQHVAMEQLAGREVTDDIMALFEQMTREELGRMREALGILLRYQTERVAEQ